MTGMKLRDTKAGGLRSAVTVLLGLAALIAGAWLSWVQISKSLYILDDVGSATSPYTRDSIILSLLWVAATVFFAIAGLSALISGLFRRRRNLIPGPTLYLLGLAVIGIGIYMLLYGQHLHGVIAVGVGVVIAWWELAFDVS